MKLMIPMIKTSQILFFLMMVAHNIFTVLLFLKESNIISLYVISRIFIDYFLHSPAGFIWYLIGILGSIIATFVLPKKYKQKHIHSWIIYSMVILTIVCGWWNIALGSHYF